MSGTAMMVLKYFVSSPVLLRCDTAKTVLKSAPGL